MGIFELLATVVLVGLGVFYVAQTLVYDFDDEENNRGPFKVPTMFIHNPLTHQSRQVHFFDFIRLAFGFYVVEKPSKHERIFKPKMSELYGKWICPHCLGFWIAVVAVIFFYNNLPFYQQIEIMLAASGVNSVLVHLTGGKYGLPVQITAETYIEKSDPE